jgi:hypothetical protein
MPYPVPGMAADAQLAPPYHHRTAQRAHTTVEVCRLTTVRRASSFSGGKIAGTSGTRCCGRARHQAARASHGSQPALSARIPRSPGQRHRALGSRCGIATTRWQTSCPYVAAAPLGANGGVFSSRLCRSCEPGGGSTSPFSLYSRGSHAPRKVRHRCATIRRHCHWSTRWHECPGWYPASASRTLDYDRSRPVDPRPWRG